MKDLYLIYVHELGANYKDKNFYEFLFSDTTLNIDGIDWDAYPAGGHPKPPREELIKEIGRIIIPFKLNVAQNNEQFSLWDAQDGVIPLSWEMLEGEEYPNPRLVFPFGLKLGDVEKKLNEREIKIEYEKKLKI